MQDDVERAASAVGAEAHVLTDADGVCIYYYSWSAARPRGIVHIGHGAGEHALRWAPTARLLADGGYTVVADDHRGHGFTGALGRGYGDLGARTTRAAIDSMQLVAETVKDESPGLALVVLGHSWGSLMAQKIIARAPLYDAAVLSGSSLAAPGVINAGNLNKRWKSEQATGLEWLSRDPEVAELFAADPHCFDIAAKPVWTPLQAFGFLGRPPKRMPRDIPVLIQGGTDDSLGGVRGMSLLRKAYRQRSRLSDVTLMLYPGARHEIYNDLNKHEVVNDLLGWLDSRIDAA
ncbi:alpha/beta hydrolase [Okibacterium endophyticum]